MDSDVMFDDRMGKNHQKVEVLKTNKKTNSPIDFHVEPPEFDNVFFYKWRKATKNCKRKGPLPFSDDSDNCLMY